MSIASLKAALAKARAKKKPARKIERKVNPVKSAPYWIRLSEDGKDFGVTVNASTLQSAKKKALAIYSGAEYLSGTRRKSEKGSITGIPGRQTNPLKKWIVFLIDEQFPDTEKGKADALAFAQRFADKHKVMLGVYKA